MNYHQNNLEADPNPYLQQHKKNLVWWQKWSDEILDYAKENNKPLLISIGYSTCHWCHVMEKECFEDEKVAQIMNKYFVCIKIDREERPDLDALYMNVVQLIHQSGGWPLNVFALPDGQPFYGGTYFPKEQWIELLNTIEQMFHKNLPKTMEYVNSIADGLKKIDKIDLKNNTNTFSIEKIHDVFSFWKQQFDEQWGGFNGAPKFMLPNAWQTILRYGIQTENEAFLKLSKLTLEKMAFGGIYDQIKGGFSRYSVDHYWKIPHFEKMLYDNGQLLSLYSNAYKIFEIEEYKNVVEQTISWLQEEMLSPEKAFFSAIDADSEGIEGMFYIWSTEELQLLLKEDYTLFSKYYNVDGFGKFEDSKNILIRTIDDNDFSSKNNISKDYLHQKINHWKKLLNKIRNQRIRPHLDNKILTCWNSITITGLCNSYQAFDENQYLILAENCMDFILKKQWNGKILFRNYIAEKSSTPGFLDDYALTVEALITLYETTTKNNYLEKAQAIVEEIFNQFFNYKNKMFSYKSHYDKPLINETFEIHDNVISSSNSIMANNLFRLGKILNHKNYLKIAQQMLINIEDKIKTYPSGFANWINLYMNFVFPFKEIVILGKESENFTKQIQNKYIPNAIFIGSKEENLELTKNRLIENKTTIYICENNTCKLPFYTIEETLNTL